MAIVRVQNSIANFQSRTLYVGIPLIVAFAATIFIILAYVLDKHRGWNAFSKHPAAIGISAGAFFLLSVLCSFIQKQRATREIRHQTQEELQGVLEREYALSQSKAAEIARMPLSQAHYYFNIVSCAIKQDQRLDGTSFQIQSGPIPDTVLLKALIRRGIPIDRPIFPNDGLFSNLFEKSLLDFVLSTAQKQPESAYEMTAFLLENGANVNGIGLSKAYFPPILKIITTKLPNKTKFIELMLAYQPNLELVKLEDLIHRLFFTTDNSGFYYLGKLLGTGADSIPTRQPEENEFDEACSLIERFVEVGVSYHDEDSYSEELDEEVSFLMDYKACPLLYRARELSQGDYSFLLPRVVHAIVQGEMKRQKIGEISLRVSSYTVLVPNIGAIISEYCLELPLGVHKELSAIRQKEQEEQYGPT